jgi:Zn-dependent protease with chaperone function
MVSSAASINFTQESKLDSLWYEYVPHLKDAFTNSIFGVFNRIITLPKRFYYCLNPAKRVEDFQSRFELTHARVDSENDPLCYLDGNVPPKENLHYIIDRVDELAKRMAIHKKIRIFPSREGAGALGTFFSKEVVVYINKEIACRPREEIDFALAHELTHVSHNHFLIESLLKTSILASEVLGTIFLSPLIIPVIEFFASPLENFGHRIRETDADQTALKILNTNRGAISYFSNRMNYFKSLKGGLWCPPEKKGYISSSGDNRLDILHPSFSKRLANAQLFQSKA